MNEEGIIPALRRQVLSGRHSLTPELVNKEHKPLCPSSRMHTWGGTVREQMATTEGGIWLEE